MTIPFCSQKGIVFLSDTDTEVIAALLNYNYNGNLVKAITEYYLLNTNEEKENIFRVLKESLLIDQEDFNEVSSIFEIADSDDENYITKSIGNFVAYLLMNRPADGSDHNQIQHMIYHTIESTTIDDIIWNIHSLIEYFGKICNQENSNIICGYFKTIADGIMIHNFSSIELKQIRDSILDIKLLEFFKDAKVADMVNNIIIDALDKAICCTYSKENIAAIISVNNENAKIISLSEFKLFKFNGILKAVINLDKFLAGKERKLLKKAKTKLSDFKNKATAILFGESTEFKENLYSYIGSDNRIDVTVRQYMLEEYDSFEMKEFLDGIIKEFNYKLDVDKMNHIRAYYIAEIHVKDSTILDLTEEEVKLVREADDPSQEIYLQMVSEIEDAYENYNHIKITNLDELLNYNTIRQCTRMNQEAFEAALEAMKYLNIDKNIVEDFVAAYSDMQFENMDKSIDESSILKNWNKVEDTPLEIALEAYSALSAIIKATSTNILSESNVEDHMKANGYTWDEDEDKDDDEEDDEKHIKKEITNKHEEKPSKKFGNGEDLPKDDEKKKTPFSLNSAILAAKGLAVKAKHYNSKAKEAIDNLDHSIRSCIKAMKDASSDEKREQIIKGSVIPSFSKCIRFGVLLVGLGIATGGVVAPVIAAIGGLAMDKKLTEKEKLLLLDEIDTELEVIDKELSMADQNNQTNKYRALLRYKKDLQRQYQRIRYNIRVGQDTAMFASDVGMQKKAD